MHKIAIITGRDFHTSSSCYYNDYCDQVKIIDTITAWEEVDDNTFKLLTEASYQGNFVIIEQPQDTKTVSDYVKQLESRKREEEARAAAEEVRKAEAARKRKEKALLKLAKDADAERALLTSLLKKHPELAKTA